jgi:hypothetical protein
MIAECFVRNVSIRSVRARVERHSSSPNTVADPFAAQSPVGSV